NVTGGTITSQPASTGFVAPVVVQGGRVTVSSGAVTQNGGSAAIAMYGAGSSVTVNGGTLTASAGGVGGSSAILMIGQDGENTLSITGGTLTGGAGSTAGGSALSIVNSTSDGSNVATISGGTLTGGSGSSAAGSGIVMNDQGTLTISGGTIGTTAGGALVLNQQKSAVLYYVSILGGTIVGGTGFTPTINMNVPIDSIGVRVSGGNFTGSWNLGSGIALVQGTNLVYGSNKMLTGTLALGQPIDISVSVQRGAQLNLQNV
ncbi:MAG TPA: hypothetical protein VKB93_27860, partial [Thermoanaerobaculia bacterium]|nr:hypothetical protein [Thermoanaerobaculia bacterium]